MSPKKPYLTMFGLILYDMSLLQMGWCLLLYTCGIGAWVFVCFRQFKSYELVSEYFMSFLISIFNVLHMCMTFWSYSDFVSWNLVHLDCKSLHWRNRACQHLFAVGLVIEAICGVSLVCVTRIIVTLLILSFYIWRR